MSEPDSGLSSTSVSPTSPNNDLIVNKINRRPAPNSVSLPIVKIREGEDKLLVEAAEDCFPMDLEQAHRVLENFKPPDAVNVQFQWHGQEAISSEDTSVRLHSQEPKVALTPLMPTHTPVKTLPAHSHLRSRQELEFRLRWKPPDTGEDSSWHAYRAVNDRPQLSAIKHLPPPGAISVPSVSRLRLAYITQAIPLCCPRLLTSR